MTKTPQEPKQDKTAPSEDEVLRRMLSTPPKPHKDKPKKEPRRAPRKG